MAEDEKKTSTKKTKKVEEVTPEKVEKKTKKATPKKEAKEVTDLVVTTEKTPVKKKATKKQVEETKAEEVKKEEVKAEEVKEEPKKESKKKAKVVGRDSKNGKPIYDDPDGEKPVKFDTKTGEPIYADQLEAKKEEIKEEKKDVKKVENLTVPPVQPVIPSEPVQVISRGDIPSEFDGKLLQLIGWYLLGFLVTVVTFGIGKPFAECFILNWQYKHTKINGRRLCFDGNGFQLLGKYIIWTLLSIITLGIYLIFLPVQWNKWVIKHTHYEGNKKPVVNYSLFDGTTWELIGISILSFFLNLFSFGLLKAFTDNLLISWRVNHTTYDNIDMEFDGKGFQLLGNYIKWTFFTIITLGIYGLWVPIKRIKWEVKHTNEKGVSKHPYKAGLAMVLPVIFCLVCIGFEIFGLTFVEKDTWTEIRRDANHYVESIVEETKKYDVSHVMAERVSDMLYRIKENKINIPWSERYQRYFEGKWYDRLSDNYMNEDLDDESEMAFMDIDGIDKPVLLVKQDDMYRVYWLYEKKVEYHYFKVEKENTGLYLATEKNGKTHMAIVDNTGGEFYHLCYIENTVNYDDHDIVYALDWETFTKKLSDKEIKLSNVDVHFTTVDLEDLSGFDALLSYYYAHTEKEYDTTPVPTTDYRDEYMAFLKDHYKTGNMVYVLEDTPLSEEVIVMVGKDKTYVLSYDEELIVSEHIGSPLKVLRDNKNNDYYVLITNEGKNTSYDFVASMIGDKESYTGVKQIRVKTSDAYKELKSKGYREVPKSIYHVELTSEKDLDIVSNKLFKKETKPEEKEEEPKEEEKKEEPKEETKKGIKADKYVLEYGDYQGDLHGIYGGTYSLLEDGSYIYINPDAMKDGKKYTLKETGKYEVKINADKKVYFCMNGNNKNNTCYEVDKDNHFKDAVHSVNFEFQE